MMSAVAASRMASVLARRRRLPAFSRLSGNMDRPSERPPVAPHPGSGDMLRLLMPKVAVEVASLQQLAMPANVVHAAALKDENRVGRHQGRQAVGNDDHGAAVRDAGNIR